MVDPHARHAPVVLPQLRLDDLLNELQGRISAVLATRDRVAGLLDAVLAIGTGLDLQTVLRRITEAAVTLADAQYGALGVIGEEGVLAQFLTVGVDESAQLEIGALPRGHGILGLLIDDPRPLRLNDLGTHPKAYGFPPNHPPMHTFLGVPLRVRDEVFGNLYLTEKRSGGSFDEEDEQIVLALAAAAGVAVENARLYETIRQRERWVTATAELAGNLLSGASPEQAAAVIARQSRELAGADGALVASPAGSPGTYLVEGSDGTLPLGEAGAALQLDGDLGERVRRAGTEALLLRGADTEQLGCSAALAWAVVVPLHTSSSTDGLLVVAAAQGSARPSSTLLAEVRDFAQRSCIALELAQRRRDSERLVVLEDRDRIAQDLHDLVIQRLFATGMRLESAMRLIPQGEASERVRGAVDDLDATIKEIRATIYALQSPPAASLTSLRAKLIEVVDAGAAQLGFSPSFRVALDIDSQVDQTVAGQLVAVLREALSNAARHANAQQVTVAVEVEDEHVVLTVTDDGVGIAAGGRRSGLTNLAGRAQRLGGAFGTSTPPGGSGTLLRWSAPCQVRLDEST